MQSKRQNSNTKTRERKIEAMRQFKDAYMKAQKAGTIKSYSVSPQN